MSALYACLTVFYAGLALTADTTFALACDIIAAVAWAACLTLQVTK